MSKRQLSPARKAIFIGGLSGASLLGGLSAERGNAEREPVAAETAQVIGLVGLGIAALKGMNIWASKQVLSWRAEEAERIEEIKQTLPKLQAPVNPRGIIADLALGREIEKTEKYDIVRHLPMLRRAAKDGQPAGSYNATWALSTDIDDLIGRLAETYRDGRIDSINDSEFHYEVGKVSWFLDEVAPIADDCTRTMQTEDDGKYWFDYIQRQAFARADMLLPFEVA
jgi:hypothetical protein